MTVVLSGDSLTVADVVRVARNAEQVELAPAALERMEAARAVVREVVGRGEEIYGFTTGVGMRKRFAVEEEMAGFNRMLIAGHLIGQGPDAPDEVVRAMTTVLANGLARGAAGARPELAQLVVDALNSGATPRVRLLGSVGQADLSANADLAAGLVGDFELDAGEGLALLNTNALSTGLAALAVADATLLLDGLDVAGALDLEALAGNPGVLHLAVADARPHPGLRATLVRLRELLKGSYLWEASPRNLQDPLSFRTVAQVHGAARDALGYVRRRGRRRAQLAPGEPARDRRGGADPLRRQLRRRPARRGARLPPHRARARAHERGRARAQAPPGAVHRVARGPRGDDPVSPSRR